MNGVVSKGEYESTTFVVNTIECGECDGLNV